MAVRTTTGAGSSTNPANDAPTRAASGTSISTATDHRNTGGTRFPYVTRTSASLNRAVEVVTQEAAESMGGRRFDCRAPGERDVAVVSVPGE